ncbi:RnfH family protein [Paraglaciecola sp. L3A3]|uniref:RnfH family protein n=1 Tax=Paraglaciecola sp. L3A3 TaxID=2686358 RepID=UPI00131E5321|nr:RnfH family protein [Paraglaciecola sp. L3A3]
MTAELITIEVVYGLPTKQVLLECKVAQGSSVEQAIETSGILSHFPDIDIQTSKVGIWNRACKLTDLPKEGDRIEIYRPLIADPKEARRRRAEKAIDEGRANKVTGGRAKALKK